MSRVKGFCMTDKIKYPVVIKGEPREDMVCFFFAELGSDAEELSEEEKGKIWESLVNTAKRYFPDLTQEWITYNLLTMEQAEMVAREFNRDEVTYNASDFVRSMAIQVPVTMKQREDFVEKLKLALSPL